MRFHRRARRRRSRLARTATWTTTATFAVALVLTVLATAMIVPSRMPPIADRPQVLVTEISTDITPVVAEHVADSLADAENGDYAAYVIELDSTGGVGTATRSIVQEMMTSEIPVIVYVTPGARAASAGAIITLASHVALMGPDSAIGAATLSASMGEQPAEEDVDDAVAFAQSLAQLRGRNEDAAAAMVHEGISLSAAEAAGQDVVDGRAATLGEALEAADGITVTVGEDNHSVVVATDKAVVDRANLGFFRQVHQLLATPEIAFVLLAIGLLGMMYQIATPGIGVAGATGLVSLLLALVGLAALPVSVAGMVLLALAAALLIGELFARGVAALAMAGGVALATGAMLLFDSAEGVRVRPLVAVGTAVVVAALAVLAGRLLAKKRDRQAGPFGGAGPGEAEAARDALGASPKP